MGAVCAGRPLLAYAALSGYPPGPATELRDSQVSPGSGTESLDPDPRENAFYPCHPKHTTGNRFLEPFTHRM